MPGDIVASLLQIVFEQVFLGVCYVTAHLLLPIVTFGRVHVEPAPRGTRVTPKWNGIHRTASGKIVLDADLGALVGLIFWITIIAVSATIYFIL